MPTLDVTDVLFDPDFCDFNLWVTRRVQTVDEDGIGSDSEVKKQFAGVVTVDRSLENRRMQAGQVISGAILIVTTERLTQGQTGRDADIVTYQGRDYRVTFVDPYTALISDTDDLQPIIDGLQAQIADKDKLIADLKDALLKLQEQNDSLQAQITAARTGGNGAKDVKESKSASGK